MNQKNLISVASFLLIVLVVIPLVIASSGRLDLYYTLTSVALLSVASAGVWLTFYIGRINIGQGAFSLMGGYVSALLITQLGINFWLTLPLAGLFCAFLAVLIGLPILRLRGVYFAMVTLVLTEVTRLTALALPITNGAKGITSIPLPTELSIFGVVLIPDFSQLANPKLAFYLRDFYSYSQYVIPLNFLDAKKFDASSYCLRVTKSENWRRRTRFWHQD